jgi:hypothetical protein
MRVGGGGPKIFLQTCLSRRVLSSRILRLVVQRKLAARSRVHAVCFMLDSCLAYSSVLKMEAVRSSDLNRTTRRYNIQDRYLHIRHCENLRSSSIRVFKPVSTSLFCWFPYNIRGKRIIW